MQQAYHNDIYLESDDTEPVDWCYGYSQIFEIWAAANVIGSHAIGLWYTPDAPILLFKGTDHHSLEQIVIGNDVDNIRHEGRVPPGLRGR